MIRYPNITGKNDAQKLDQMKSYLHQLADELNYQLDKTSNIGSGYLPSSVEAGAVAKPVKKDDPISNFNEIKGLIIKSADIVDAYSEEISKTLNGQYVAVSDFGTYKEETQAQLTASSDQIKTVVEKQEEIETNLDNPESEFRREISSEIQQTADSINLKVVNDTEGKMAGIQLTVGEKDSGQIDMTGLVTFTNLTDGKTTISGDNIKTGQILADLIKAGILASNDGSVRFDLNNNIIEFIGDPWSTAPEGTRSRCVLKNDSGGFSLWSQSAGGVLGLSISATNTGASIGIWKDEAGVAGMRLLNNGKGGIYASQVSVWDAPTVSTDAVNKAYVDGNFAPAGYGLAGIAPGTSDCDTALNTGWHQFGVDTLHKPDSTSIWTYGLLHVMRRKDYQVVQVAYSMDGNNYMAIRQMYGWGADATFGAWEYVNPPMYPGVEYRTTERYSGKPVYTIACNFGALPNNTTKTVTVKTTDGNDVSFVEIVNVRCSETNSGGRNVTDNCWITGGAVMRINCNTTYDASGTTMMVTVKYTKG